MFFQYEQESITVGCVPPAFLIRGCLPNPQADPLNADPPRYRLPLGRPCGCRPPRYRPLCRQTVDSEWLSMRMSFQLKYEFLDTSEP